MPEQSDYFTRFGNIDPEQLARMRAKAEAAGELLDEELRGVTRFTDRTGEQWTFHITRGVAARLKGVGLDVEALRSAPGQLFDLAATGGEGLLRALDVALAEQMAAKGMTAEQFDDRFDGPTIATAAEAFAVALLHYMFPRTAGPLVAQFRAALAELGTTGAK